MLVAKLFFVLIPISASYASEEIFCNDDSDFFYCGKDGASMCIPYDWVCDYVPDCPNGKDEINCQYLHFCTKGDYMCSNGHCVSATFKCDNHSDCEDNSDEKNCYRTPKTRNQTSSPLMSSAIGVGLPKLVHDFVNTVNKCNASEYFCGEDGANKCIPADWKCDYVRDCPNGRDEDSCEYPVHCLEGQFLCHNGQCIDAMHKCDSIAFCDDRSDEFFCDGYKGKNAQRPGPTSTTTLQTASSQKPSNRPSRIQMATPQTAPTSTNTSTASCTSVSEFFCKADNKCIDVRLRCNGKFNCESGEDEIGCALCESEGMKTCANGVGCYYQECDGFKHCADGSDEKDCDLKPQNDQFWSNPPKTPYGQCEFLKEYQESLEAYMQTTMSFLRKMSTPPPCPQSDFESSRSVLIEGIPEPYTREPPSSRRAKDVQAITMYFDRLGIEAFPTDFYRIGSYSPQRMRNIIAVFPTQSQQAEVLEKYEATSKSYPQANGIMIKPVN